MGPALKRLSEDAIPRALERANHYRLLNEPWEAESICRDVLATEPGNQKALVYLLLALTDQFDDAPGGVSATQAQAILARLADEYERAYYAGVILERWAKAQLRSHHSAHAVHDLFAEALGRYERASALAPHGNEDAVLRWNACVRLLERHPHIGPLDDALAIEAGGDEAPTR